MASSTAAPISGVPILNNYFDPGQYGYMLIRDNSRVWTNNIDDDSQRYLNSGGSLGAMPRPIPAPTRFPIPPTHQPDPDPTPPPPRRRESRRRCRHEVQRHAEGNAAPTR